MPVGYYACFDERKANEEDEAKLGRWKNPYEVPKPIHFHSLMSLEEERLANAIYELTSRISLDIYESNLKLYPNSAGEARKNRPYHDLDKMLQETLLESAALAKHKMKEEKYLKSLETLPKEV